MPQEAVHVPQNLEYDIHMALSQGKDSHVHLTQEEDTQMLSTL